MEGAAILLSMEFVWMEEVEESAPQVLTAGITLEEVSVIGMGGAVLQLTIEFVLMEEEEESAPQAVTAGLIVEEVYVIGMEGAAILLSMEFVWVEVVEELTACCLPGQYGLNVPVAPEPRGQGLGPAWLREEDPG